MALIERFTPGGNLYPDGSSTFATLVQFFQRWAENRDTMDQTIAQTASVQAAEAVAVNTLQPSQDPEAIFSVTDEDGRRTWVEVAPDGGPTQWSADKLAPAVAGPVAESVGISEMSTAITGMAFAITDEDGRRTWLEADEDGGPTGYTVEKLSAALGTTSGGAVSSIAPPRVNSPDVFTPGPGVPATWQTYDGSGVTVHPSVRYFPDGFAGYRWWAASTPYPGTDSQYENPCIYVSTNGIDWTPPPGVTNPLVPDPGQPAYQSDTHLVEHGGVLYLFFRRNDNGEHLFCMESPNGVNWSDPVLIHHAPASGSSALSPAVWFDPLEGVWVMLTCTGSGARDVHRRTAGTPYGPWSAPAVVPIAPVLGSTEMPWHIDAMDIGGQVHALIAAGDQTGGPVYLATSEDSGRTFTRATTPVLASGGYRSCLLPFTGPTGLYLRAWVGHAGPNWGVTVHDLTAS